MNQVAADFHVHTLYSDGTGRHLEVASAAAQAGLEVLMFTDHNVWTSHHTGWYDDPATGRRVLLLMGQEVHDATLSPSINHYLCLGVTQDVHDYAPCPQELIDACTRHGGVGFVAHPMERPVPIYPIDSAYPWLAWEVRGYTGIELWNYMSEFKSRLTSVPVALLASFLPSLFIRGPGPELLALWDSLMSDGRKVVAIGNSDAHASVYPIGPFKRRVFEYKYLFQMVNTYLVLDAPLAEDWEMARQQVLDALRAGHAFIAYRLAGSARGFCFEAKTSGTQAIMGDEVTLQSDLVLHVQLPQSADLRLLKDGREVARVHGHRLEYPVREPGVYRVQAYRNPGLLRALRLNQAPAWIVSNPIYVRAEKEGGSNERT